jgi:Ran-binding protein 3
MSPFGSFGVGFGGSAFTAGFAAAAANSGGGLTGFAAPGGPGVQGYSLQPKVLGTQSDDEDEGDDDEKPSFEGLEEEKEDERFYKQESKKNSLFLNQGPFCTIVYNFFSPMSKKYFQLTKDD